MNYYKEMPVIGGGSFSAIIASRAFDENSKSSKTILAYEEDEEDDEEEIYTSPLRKSVQNEINNMTPKDIIEALIESRDYGLWAQDNRSLSDDKEEDRHYIRSELIENEIVAALILYKSYKNA